MFVEKLYHERVIVSSIFCLATRLRFKRRSGAIGEVFFSFLKNLVRYVMSACLALLANLKQGKLRWIPISGFLIQLSQILTILLGETANILFPELTGFDQVPQ